MSWWCQEWGKTKGWPLSHQPGRSWGKDGAGNVPSPLCGPRLLRGSGQHLLALEGHYLSCCAEEWPRGRREAQALPASPKGCSSPILTLPAAGPRGLGSCFSGAIRELSHKVVSKTAGICQDKITVQDGSSYLKWLNVFIFFYGNFLFFFYI